MVRPAPTTDTACDMRAAESFGVISRQEALSLGMTGHQIKWRLGTGEWEIIFPNVYRLAASSPTWFGDLYGAMLWAGPGAAISHRSAAAIWGLTGFDEGPLDLVSTRDRRDPRVKVHRVSSLPRNDISRVGLLVVTSPLRTLFELGSVVCQDQVEAAVEDALRKRMVTMRRISNLLKEVKFGYRGAAILRKCLDDLTGQQVTESEFERRLRKVLRRGGLPLPQAQYPVRDANGKQRRIDFAYPDQMVAIEADSYRFHSGRRDWGKDRTRSNDLSVLGWRIIRVTWVDLHRRPSKVIETVRRSLGV